MGVQKLILEMKHFSEFTVTEYARESGNNINFEITFSAHRDLWSFRSGLPPRPDANFLAISLKFVSSTRRLASALSSGDLSIFDEDVIERSLVDYGLTMA
eukprot:Selendium_serpulae@DN1700_c0_g1_i1.p1